MKVEMDGWMCGLHFSLSLFFLSSVSLFPLAFFIVLLFLLLIIVFFFAPFFSFLLFSAPSSWLFLSCYHMNHTQYTVVLFSLLLVLNLPSYPSIDRYEPLSMSRDLVHRDITQLG
jgi:hypothetical protein